MFKSIQKMLSSVENTTFGQIQDVTNDGEYIVMVPKGSIPSTISDLVMVVIRGSGYSQTVKTKYSLDDLKDLQSKLALIRGNISDRKIQHMAEAFWQVWLWIFHMSVMPCIHDNSHIFVLPVKPPLRLCVCFLYYSVGFGTDCPIG